MPGFFTLPLPPATGHDYYTSCYLLAFGVQLALLLRTGYRRRYPMATWLVVLAGTTLFFVLGTRLLTMSGAEWSALLQAGRWPEFGARTVLGGAVGGGLALLLLRRLFGFSAHLYDAFAVPLCVGLMVQCVGCLLVGCCFGEPTASGWGLTYAPNTLPYLAQTQHGWLPAGAAHSLAVHPTQLYCLVLCAAVALVLVLTRRQPWPAGSRLWLQLGLLLAGRFLIEFWRDPLGEPVGATVRTYGGVPLLELQWVLLLAAPVVLGGWAWGVWRARRQQPAPEQVPAVRPARLLLVVASMLLLTVWLGPFTLALPEVLLLRALLLALLGLAVVAWLRAGRGAVATARVGVPLGLAGVVLVLTSQMAPPDSAARTQQYYTLSAGLSQGSFERLQNREDNCGGSTELLPYQHRYTLGTLDVARTRTAGVDLDGTPHKAEITSGVRLHVGTDRQTTPLPDSLQAFVYPHFRSRTLLLAINPYLQAERKYFGLGFGLALGRLGYHRGNSGNDISVADVHASLRLGPRELLFAQADYNYMAYGTGNPPLRLGLGTGLGGTRWQLLGGATLARHYDLLPGQRCWAGFAEVKGQVAPLWGIGAYLTTGNASQQQAGFRLSRRLGQ